ncbi:MAG: hypothetical protein ACFUZC_14175 [Chthoniobacteraceae bacterium]
MASSISVEETPVMSVTTLWSLMLALSRAFCSSLAAWPRLAASELRWYRSFWFR